MPHPTQIVSALADTHRLQLFSRIVCAGSDGVPLAAIRQEDPDGVRHIGRLLQAGLVSRRADGLLTARQEAFRDAALRHEAPRTDPLEPSGDQAVSRLFSEGRLTAIPRKHELRQALLRHLAERLFSPDAVYSEAQVNKAISAYYPDHSTLRRYLVDAGFLTRSTDGREYRVAAASSLV